MAIDLRQGEARAVLERAWGDRWKDSQILLESGRNATSIVQALYAVEILLKALVCKKLDVDHLPRAFHIHDLNGLLVLAGLSRELEARAGRKVRDAWEALDSVSDSLNDLRYQPSANWNRRTAQRTRKHVEGVLGWLKTYL